MKLKTIQIARDRLIQIRHVNGRGCWVSKLKPHRKFYGRIEIMGISHRMHRLSYQVFIGNIPKGLDVLHECDNKPCFNPSHLFTGTAKDNALDAIKKGIWNPSAAGKKGMAARKSNPLCFTTQAKGSKNGWSKLTEPKVLHIRRLGASGVMGKDIATRFNIAPTTVSGILKRKQWRHI